MLSFIQLSWGQGTADLNGPDADPKRPGWHERAMRVGHLERWYRVYVPTPLPEKARTVVLLHGGTQSMRKIFMPRAGGTRAWLDLADREGFLLLVPNGVNQETGDTRGDNQNWNDLRPTGPGRAVNADDVGFIGQLLDWAQATYRTDAQRVYVTGASNGGMMTYRLLMECPERFAAGAAFIAGLPHTSAPLPTPARATPLLIANGTKDPLVKWEGGEIPGRRGRVISAEATVAWWVKANGADAAAAVTEALPDEDPKDGCRIFCTTYPAKPGGAPVVFYRIEGGGHALPSRAHDLPKTPLVKRLIGTLCRDAEGAELAWEFMKSRK